MQEHNLTQEIVKNEKLKLVVEGYRNIQDKEPLYRFERDSFRPALCLAEVMIEGDELNYVCIFDEATDLLMKEFKK